MTKIKELPINDRPIERLINKGSNVLSNDELLAILLNTGTKDLSSKDLALKILKETDINNLKYINYEKLININGIGPKKASIVLAAIELSKRMNQKIEHLKNIKMNHPSILYDYYKEILKDEKQEHFYAVYLDQKNKIIKDKHLFIGTIKYSLVHPREIFKEAYMIGAISIVIVHNHPSDDIMPSKNDYDTTNKIIEVGNLLGIKIIDHIIIVFMKMVIYEKVCNYYFCIIYPIVFIIYFD